MRKQTINTKIDIEREYAGSRKKWLAWYAQNNGATQP
jgi:hypothetical protein